MSLPHFGCSVVGPREGFSCLGKPDPRQCVTWGMDDRHALRSVLVLALAAVVAACSGGQGRTSEAGGVTPAPTATPSRSAMRPAPVDHTVIPVGHAPHRVTAAAGAVWVAGGTGSVYRVAPGAGTARLVRDTGVQLTEVTAAAGRVFAGDNRGSRLLVLDAGTGRELRALRMPGPVRGVLAGLGAVWVTAGSAVVRVDPATLRVDSVTEVGGEAAQMALAGRSVIVSNRALGTLVQLDDHGRLGGTADVDGPTIGLVVTGSRIFAARSDRPGMAVLSRERFAYVGDVELPGVQLRRRCRRRRGVADPGRPGRAGPAVRVGGGARPGAGRAAAAGDRRG